MRAITVRQEFSALKDFATNLPQTFDGQGLVIHNSRNVIKKIDTSQGTFVVKNFAGMYFFNRLAYSLFRKSKAARSYLYSAMLNERGIKTPPHVAWIDCYSMGLLTRSYFVSVFYPYQTLEQIIQYYNILDPSYKTTLIKNLAAFIHKLHKSGIYHEDLSIGNILVVRTVKGYEFVLVDLNRIKFREIGTTDGLRNLTTLQLAADDMSTLISEYASLTGQNARAAISFFSVYQKRKYMIRSVRKRIRRYTIKPFEILLGRKH